MRERERLDDTEHLQVAYSTCCSFSFSFSSQSSASGVFPCSLPSAFTSQWRYTQATDTRCSLRVTAPQFVSLLTHICTSVFWSLLWIISRDSVRLTTPWSGSWFPVRRSTCLTSESVSVWDTRNRFITWSRSVGAGQWQPQSKVTRPKAFVLTGWQLCQDDTSGDYKRTLLNLCGGDDE